MDGFTYVDVFATKGIEYLLVIVYLIAFLFFIRALFADSGQRHAPVSNDRIDGSSRAVRRTAGE